MFYTRVSDLPSDTSRRPHPPGPATLRPRTTDRRSSAAFASAEHEKDAVPPRRLELRIKDSAAEESPCTRQ